MHILFIDIQERLVPAMASAGDAMVLNAGRLVSAARLLGIGTTFTEQNPARLGPTVAAIDAPAGEALPKMTFDASALVLDRMPPGEPILVCGCEAHICVMQTVLGLLKAKREVIVVSDAVASRTDQNRELALARMARHGADIASCEMVLFDWIGGADHPHFREISRLIR